MVLGVLCLCVVGEAAASTTTAHIISFLQLFFSAFAAIYLLYTIIPFHFVQQLFFCVSGVCYQMEMEHNFISRMSERVTLGYQIKNSSFPSSFLVYSYFSA